MSIISVNDLTRQFKIYKKQPGIIGSMSSLFNRQYYDTTAVDHISFSIEEGELIGFIGPNGAGKTTTLKMLSGLLYPTSGHVNVLGHVPFKREPAFLKKIALVMGQKNQLWWDVPAMDTFLLNKEIYEIPTKYFQDTLEELSSLLEVKDILLVQVRKLSLGQRMKCELIAALLHKPKVLFLDEPTIGLDVVMQQKLRDFIRDYNQKFKSTIILTSHYMEDVKELCKRIIVIDHGHVLYDGKLQDIIRKFGTHKLITVIFSRPVSREQLVELGEIKEHLDIKTILKVPFDASNKTAARLLEHFPVEDLNIEEPDIQEIIREVFAGSTV